MAGLSSLTGSVSTEFKWTAQNNLTGANYSPISNVGDLKRSQTLGTASANAASGGADEVFSFQQAVSAGSSATLNLLNMTNILQQSAVVIARIKAIMIRLLSTLDDSTVAANASAGLITNRDVAVPAALFPNGGTGLTVTLTTVAGAITGVAIGVAGSGYPPSTTFLAVPQQAGGSGGSVLVTTNGSGVPTSVALGAGGTGYTNATVPTTPSGHHILNGGSTTLNGSAYCYVDSLAAGYALVSATAENIKFVNLDGAHAATFEVDIYAGST